MKVEIFDEKTSVKALGKTYQCLLRVDNWQRCRSSAAPTLTPVLQGQFFLGLWLGHAGYKQASTFSSYYHDFSGQYSKDMYVVDVPWPICWMSRECLGVHLVLLAHPLVGDGSPLPHGAPWTDSEEGWQGEIKKKGPTHPSRENK